MVLATAQAQRKALQLKPSIIMGGLLPVVAKCKFYLRFGQVTSRYGYYLCISCKTSPSPFASMSTSDSLISPTLFRCYASTFFARNSRGIFRVSPWSLRHGILQLKWHSRVARGVVLIILGSVVGQNPWITVMGAMEVEEEEAIMVPWKRRVNLMAIGIRISILRNSAMRLPRTGEG
jgi:hypothetical protein